VFKFKKKKLISLAVVVSLILFLSASIPALRAPILNTLKQPFILLNFVRREIGGIIFYHRNLIRNEKFGRENDLLRQKLNTLNEIYLENVRLKKLLFLKQQSPYKLTAARVIGRSADSWSSVIIIDKGTSHGITRGMAAITYLGLLGRVVETSESTSKIMLISDPNLGVSGIAQRSRQEGLVCGTLGSHLIMKYLPEEADIKVSDVVVTSGLNGEYPKGLLIGRVIDIGREFSGLSRYAIIEPAVKLSNIEEVSIIIQ
jgi:rod shape-determining protein MreC